MQGTTTPNGPVGLPASRPAVPAHSQPSSSPTPRPASSACDPPAEGAPSLSSAGGVPGEARSRRPGSPALTGREPAGWAALFWELPQGWRSRERPHGASPGFPPPETVGGCEREGGAQSRGSRRGAALPHARRHSLTHSLTFAAMLATAPRRRREGRDERPARGAGPAGPSGRRRRGRRRPTGPGPGPGTARGTARPPAEPAARRPLWRSPRSCGQLTSGSPFICLPFSSQGTPSRRRPPTPPPE